MNREIFCRAKRSDTGTWVFGSYVGALGGKHYIIQAWSYKPELWDYFEVLPDTVGQFTGLTDKNGTKIFEGDIDQYGGIVEYDSLARFCINYGHSVSLTYTETTFHITGNIHDNPIQNDI